MRVATIVGLMLSMPPAAAVDAQHLPPDPFRIRVTDGERRETGRLSRVARSAAPDAMLRVGDTIVLVRHGATTESRLALGPRTRVEHSLGRGSALGYGAIVGGLVAGGLLVLTMERCEHRATSGEGPPCGLAYLGLPMAVGAGGLAGALVGLFIPGRERWRRMPVRPAPR